MPTITNGGNGGSSVTSTKTKSHPGSPNIKSWWLKDVQDTSLTVPLYTVEPYSIQINEMSSTYRVLGRERPIVVADTVMGRDGTMNAVIIGRSNLEKMVAAFAAQHVMLLHSPYGDHMYIRHASMPGTATSGSVATFSYNQQFSAKGEEYYEITFDFVQVERPNT